MLEHLPFVQRGVVAEGKAKVAGAKKVGKLIVGYWEREGGREERERKDEERLRKNGARALGKMIRGKWRLAVNVSRILKTVATLWERREDARYDS